MRNGPQATVGAGEKRTTRARDVKSAMANRLAIIACPCCGENRTHVIYRARSVPIHSCVLLDSAAEARSFPRGHIEIAFCACCGFLFNHLFDQNLMAYSPNFEESQHFSPTFSSFARELAREIVNKCNITGKSVLEIGCGKGEFIAELCSIAQAKGVGIDPAYRFDRGRGNSADVRFIVDRYTTDYHNLPADLILCRHTLEHISDVSAFVRTIRESIGEREDVWVVFETPDAKRVLEEGAFWDIYYEHCSYFSLGAHARLFRRERFDVTEFSVVYRGQYIVQYARPSAFVTTSRLRGENDLDEIRSLAASFPQRISEKQSKWKRRIRDAANAGRCVVIWGGSSKSVSFLTTLGLQDQVSAVVDVNPYRQGRFTPGTGHEIIPPSELSILRPDLVVVMNPVYEREVKAELSALDLEPEVLCCL